MHHHPRTLLADDLTGALDTAARLASDTPARVLCTWDAGALAALPTDAVWVFDTETRNVNEAVAGPSVTAVMRALAAVDRTIDYLKIDSTLRGPILATVAAVIRDTASAGALICPALPSQGRTVVDGQVYVHGVPLQNTDLGRDPLAPAATSFGARLRTHWGEAAVASGTVKQLRPRVRQGAYVFFADAQTDSDLRRLMRFATRHRLLPVGSAGLAAAWAHAGARQPRIDTQALALPRPLVFVNGSPAARTRAQTAALIATDPRLTVLHPPRAGLLADAQSPLRAQMQQQTRRALQRALAAGQDVLLDLAHVPKEQILAAEGSAAEVKEHAARILAALASWTENLDAAGTLILLGGDTAYAALRAAGTAAIEVRGSAQPQIPYGRIHGGRWHNKWLVTKAGGFGDDDVLVRLRAGGTHR